MTTAPDVLGKKRPGRKGAVGPLLPMLTEATLCALLDRDVLRGSMRRPSKECLEKLAKSVYFFRFLASPVGQEVRLQKQRESRQLTAAPKR
jgi:hypothetical protein